MLFHVDHEVLLGAELVLKLLWTERLCILPLSIYGRNIIGHRLILHHVY